MSLDNLEAREDALQRAIDLLRNGVIEYCVEDILVVADWLLTGKADLVVALNKQRSENYLRLKQAEEDTDEPGR